MIRVLLFVSLLAGSCSMRPIPAYADVTAHVSVAQDGDRLWAYVTVSGIEGCPTSGFVMVEWTSPNESLFASSLYQAPYRSCAAAGGTARTNAYRTLRYTYPTRRRGRQVARALGVWTVRVLDGDRVIASAEYDVTEVE